MVPTCTTCGTTLDTAGACVTCAAKAEGLHLLRRAPYDQTRELQLLLEEQGIGAEIEQVPAASPQEKQRPLWNLYVPKDGVEGASAFLKEDWNTLLQDPDAAAAAARGDGMKLSGGELDCPACGQRFAVSAAQPDCPECGLVLWAGEDPAGGDAAGGTPA